MLNKKALAASVSASPAEYVEDVFSTYLYTGNGGGTRSITNGIDLSGEGGLVWIKGRSGVADHVLYDTARGSTPGRLYTNSTAAEDTSYQEFSSFNSDGFSIYHNADAGYINVNNTTYCSWTFRKAKKFFDVVTYTGNGANDQTISHNLGSTPGFIVVKATSTTSAWWCYHRGLSTPNNFQIRLSSDAAAGDTGGNAWNVTSTTFNASGSLLGINASGQTYVAYLFAHNAGGFGTAGTDNIISCGSFTTDANGNATVNLGYEPQYLLYKSTSAAGSWTILDTMRGFCATANSSNRLAAQSSSAESTGLGGSPSATGFYGDNANMFAASNTDYIYMAIRRPMKTPTSGTEVFKPVARTGTDSSVTINAGFTVDMNIATSRDKAIQSNTPVVDRLRGGSVGHPYLRTNTSNPDNTGTASGMYEFTQNGVYTYNTIFNSSSETYVHWMFKRAPEFFDIVCYTGTGSTTTLTHNLTIPPELIIVKNRTNSSNWFVYHNAYGANYSGILNSTSNWSTNSTIWNNTEPTSTVFTVGASTDVNTSGDNYVAYLFSTLAGISKVGSYTGNGSSQTINCGFTAGARFVLIKSGDNNTDWCVFDTARGIVSGNDPFMRINTTVAEITGQDAVDPTNSGFIVNETTELLNTNTKTYLYLAIA